MGVWHTYSTRQTLSELETDKSRGLSGAEAERRLARWGPNRLEEGRRQGLLLRFLGPVSYTHLDVYKRQRPSSALPSTRWRSTWSAASAPRPR